MDQIKITITKDSKDTELILRSHEFEKVFSKLEGDLVSYQVKIERVGPTLNLDSLNQTYETEPV